MSGAAFECEYCAPIDHTRAAWRIERVGDVVVAWACDVHLGLTCNRLQRDDEITVLCVSLASKAREWNEIRRSLDSVAHDSEAGGRG